GGGGVGGGEDGGGGSRGGGGGKVPGEGDRRADPAGGARPARRGARRDRRADQRNRDATEYRPARRTERPRCVLEPSVETAQHAFHGKHEERHRDERLGQDGAGGGEGQANAERVEPLSEETAASEHREERDAADDRRQHDRKQRQRAQDRASGKAAACLDPGEGQAEDDGEGGRGERADERQPHGHQGLRLEERGAEIAP